MVQDGTGGGEAISDVIVPEGANEHFVYSRQNNLSKSLVGAVVLVEECGGGVESIAKFGDLGTSGVGRIMGTEPGLTGTMKRVDDKVL